MPVLVDENVPLRVALAALKVDAISHKGEVANLRSQFPHTITFEAWNHEETCVPWALRLTGDAVYEGVRRRHQEIFAGAAFAGWICDRHLVELPTPKLDCLVFYSADEAFKHAGIMIGEDRVRSKWGELPRYTHQLAEVPANYGSRVSFFARPSEQEARDWFRAFAMHSGLTSEQISLAQQGE